MAKNSRKKIKLISSSGTGHFYTTSKNQKNNNKKLSIKKFDPIIKKHVLYDEKKIK
ncbi:50S ribosomal protein L33 [Candidatus Riesia pediculischaeffi]|uniref:Large ribosomal subunit protein bL33 n=2 Tax=Candidatus Riesia pediculischaeffi TaxID=428411 RepID=A0A1V0HK07_9ENTR|nr:50S ribosomal protein L33 [Candidatus Riesia pediculischaeffi]ARC53163.1 50S ribosomal protein L33 [Candidatus Riesia pediculischaeffi]KIE64208.1 LSU ribosomal protein L33p [Candidatus Riesia pediculischaeffi PTSU]